MSSVQPQDIASAGGKSAAVNALGILGALFWSIQLLPQIWLNYRKKDTTGLQPSMMLLWACAGLPLGAHNILGGQNVALQVQAQILTSLSLLTWGQVMYYGHKWSRIRTWLVLLGLFLLFGGVEVAFVVGFKYGLPLDSSPAPLPLLLTLAILSAVLLSLGVLRHYYDAYTHRTVRGISWAFVLLDAAGDLASLLSVLLDEPSTSWGGAGERGREKDIERWAAAAIYASELALWTGLMILGVVWNGRSWFLRRRREATERSLQVASSRSESTLQNRGQTAPGDADVASNDADSPRPPSVASSLSEARSVFRTSSRISRDVGSDVESPLPSGSGGLVERLRMRRVGRGRQLASTGRLESG